MMGANMDMDSHSLFLYPWNKQTMTVVGGWMCICHRNLSQECLRVNGVHLCHGKQTVNTNSLLAFYK